MAKYCTPPAFEPLQAKGDSDPHLFPRGDYGIWTRDLLVANETRYQTAPSPRGALGRRRARRTQDIRSGTGLASGYLTFRCLHSVELTRNDHIPPEGW